MRLSTWTATPTSVARRSSVRERSPSPITRLYRLITVSAQARLLYPEAFCQAIRPRSAMSWRWRPAAWAHARPLYSAPQLSARGHDDGRFEIAFADAGVH